MPNWSAAQAASNGYRDEVIVDYQVDLVRRARERRGAGVEASAQFLRTAAALLAVRERLRARGAAQPLRVADVGGQDGGVFYEFARHVPSLSLDWYVFETPKLHSALSAEGMDSDSGPSGSTIQWHRVGDHATQQWDVTLAAGVLQLVEHPYEELRTMMGVSRATILDKVPVTELDEDVATLRRSPLSHSKSYPAWLFSRTSLVETVSGMGDIAFQWPDETLMAFEGARVSFVGLLLLAR